MKNYHFSIIVEQDKNGFFVSCPELQGCYSQGDTYEEALQNIKDAIQLHVEDRIAAKESISSAKSISLSVLDIVA